MTEPCGAARALPATEIPADSARMSFEQQFSTWRRNGEFDALIEGLRKAVRKDRRVLEHWLVKDWCGRRWRNLFLGEAIKDERALDAAGSGWLKGKDRRPDRQKIAERFLRGHGRSEWAEQMPDAAYQAVTRTTLVFCPGLLNGLLPVRAFQKELPEVENELGLKVLRADLHPLASCDSNAKDLAAALEQGAGLSADCRVLSDDERQAPGDVFLMGYSKGMADILTFLVGYPELAKRVRCVFGWAGAGGGSYIADDALKVLDQVEEDPEKLEKLVGTLAPIADLPEIVSRRHTETSIKEAVLHLTTGYREAFLAEHEESLNALGIPFFNHPGSTSLSKAPSFQIQGVARLNSFDRNNDMQVTEEQACLRFPMATKLAMLKAHHWDLSYGPFPKRLRITSPHLDHPFPRKAALFAHVYLAQELGLID